jgi:hypothetical protein
MSLAVLARKTRTKQKLKSSKRGFVLNMTGRGGGIGLSGMSYKQRGAVKSVKQRSNCKESWTATFEFIPNETSGPNITTAQGLRLALGLYPLFGSGSEVKPLATIADSYTILSQRPHIFDDGVTLIIFTLKMNFKKLYSVNITQAAFTLIKWEGSAPTGLVEWSLYSSINGYQRIGNSITIDAAVGFGSVPVAKSPDFRFERCNGSCTGSCTGKTGQSGTCCAADKIVEKSVRDACGQCWYGGMSQPAPQMSYRNYINRKASGAYRPGGGPCCVPKCLRTKHGVVCNKNPNTWKQHPNISASEITEHKKLSTIRCANGLVKRNQVKLGNVVISNRITAKPVCSWYNPETCKYETVKKCNPIQSECRGGRRCALPIKGRLGYTRINKNWCNTTKTLTTNESSGDQIAKRKQVAFNCPCAKIDFSSNNISDKCTVLENNKRSSNRYCYPRPMAMGNNRGLLDEKTKERIACLRTGCT